MNINYFETKVLENIEVSNGIYKMIVSEKNDIKPGQFYMLLPKTALLGRPISICEKIDDTLVFYYASVGTGTREFSNIKSGENIKVFGPLGNGFDVEKIASENNKIAIVSGGIGTAPMIETAKRLRTIKKDLVIDSYFGFRDDVYLEDEIKKYSNEYHCATNTGTHGHKGFVTDMIDVSKYDIVLCCGPEVMMNKVIMMCREKDTKVLVSMEKHMACGVGACLVCTCKTTLGNKRTCKDGPVFDGADIIL